MQDNSRLNRVTSMQRDAVRGKKSSREATRPAGSRSNIHVAGAGRQKILREKQKCKKYFRCINF